MKRDPRVKCGRCRRWMRRSPTAKTPLTRARPPHDRICVDCAPATVDAFRPVSPGQISALHAKCNGIGAQTGRASADWKTDVKAAAELAFGIDVTSFKDLTYEQASWCLDWLDERAWVAA